MRKYETTLNREKFKKLDEAEPEIIAEFEARVVNAAIGEYKAPTYKPVKRVVTAINKGGSEYDKVNAEIYNIANSAMKHPGVTNIPTEMRDPLILLSQSMTEYLDRTDVQKVWVPAIPVKFLPNESINVETLKTFNVAQGLKLKGFAQSVARNKTFQGPYQLSPTYGISNNPNFDSTGVIYKSEMENIQADAESLAIFNGGVGWHGSRVRQSGGDRHNFNDASIVAIQAWDYYYGKVGNVNKSKMLNQSSLVAFIAMNHNIGQSVAVERNMSRPSRICSGCTYGDIWDYIEWFGKDEIIEVFRKEADRKVAVFKQTGKLSHINKEEARIILESNPAGTTIASRINYNGEKGMHPVRMVMWYYVLEELYHGD